VFPFIHGPPRGSVDAKPDPAVLQFIRPIAVPTSPGAMNQTAENPRVSVL
jgi:hypothetical protein